MAMQEGVQAGRSPDWTASTTLAVVGAVFGIVAAALLLLGVGAGLAVRGTMVPGVLAAYIGASNAANIGLAVLIFITLGAVKTLGVRGGLLVLWGVIGLFLGFGLWFGAVLVIIAGFLAYFEQRPGAPMGGRRPVA